MQIKEGPSWERGNELLGVGVLWGTENLCWRTTLDNFPFIENCNAMTKRGNR